MVQSGSGAVAERDKQIEGAILGLLLDFESGSLWSEDELERGLGASHSEVADGLVALHAAGLVHRCGEFVFATRAASRFDDLDL